MVTALAFYEGASLGSLQLVGVTVDEHVIAEVVAMIDDRDLRVLPTTVKAARRRRRKKLHVVPDSAEEVQV